MRLVRISKGWDYDFILYKLPFAAGLQMIHAEDSSNGIEREWTSDRRKESPGAMAAIEAAFF